MKTLDTMTKSTLIEMIENLQTELTTATDGYVLLDAGQATRTRKAGVVSFDGAKIKVTQTDGKAADYDINQFFAHPKVMAHLLQYAIVRASTDTAHEKGMIGFMDAWAKGFTSPADYEQSLKVIAPKPTKEPKAAKAAKAELTDAEYISTIEQLGGDFEKLATMLLTTPATLFMPSIEHLAGKYPEVATAIAQRIEAKRLELLAAAQAEEARVKAELVAQLAAMWG